MSFLVWVAAYRLTKGRDMRNLRKDAKVGVLVFIAALVVCQAIRLEKSNPQARLDAALDPAIKPLLKRACYNCHSNETVWPWYSYVAPVSWLVTSDVREGRQHVNFSEWMNYSAEVQGHKKYQIGQEVEQKAMPPWYYSIMHGEARLSTEERDRIKAWASPSSHSGH
jgi:hypothetical protein